MLPREAYRRTLRCSLRGGSRPGNSTILLIAVPLVGGIKFAGHLAQSRREALQECHRPGPLADIVGQVHATAFAADRVVELRGEVSRLVDQAAARGRARDDHTTRPEHHLVKRVARIALTEILQLRVVTGPGF